MALISYNISRTDRIVEKLLSLIKNKKAYNQGSDLETENNIANFFENIRPDIYALIEYPYVDKLYRDSYYTYFASKHKSYSRDCIRICLFERKIQKSDFRNKDREGYLQELFLGFLVLRPTFPRVIGRSLISKRAVIDNEFLTCQCTINVLVNGVKLNVSGFPHCSQDGESISCAETTIWSIMEYFSSRYPEYKPTLPSSIFKILNQQSKQRLLPSTGLTLDQISYAVKEFGFGSYIYSRDITIPDKQQELHDLIGIYIESGIPVIAFLEKGLDAHALLIVGRTKVDASEINTLEYSDFNDLDKRFIIQDDNLAPYKSIDLYNPVEHHLQIDPTFEGYNIASIIIPLYNKIYLEATGAKKLIYSILSDTDYGYSFTSQYMIRFFLTSSRSFKHHVSSIQNFNKFLQDDIIALSMPKFVWCAEIYDLKGFKTNNPIGLIVVDATEPSTIYALARSVLYIGYPDRSYFNLDSNEEFIPLNIQFTGFQTFYSNLI